MKGKRVNNNKIRRQRKGSRRKSAALSRPLARIFDLDFPKEFRLAQGVSRVVRFVGKLRQLLEKQGARPPRIRFSNIAKIDIAAALMLGAEIQARVHNAPNFRPHFYNGPWHPEVKNLLTGMRLFPVLNAPHSDAPALARSEHLLLMPVISHSSVDMEKFIAWRESIEREIKGAMSASHYFFIGLSEAITNAVQHAYTSNQPREWWWASASYDKSTRELIVLCYDRGQTIPKTLPFSEFKEAIATVMSRLGLRKNIDSDLIEAALRHRRTITKKSHRGHGLRQLMYFVDEVEKGALRVYSRRGLVEYTKSESGEGNYKKKNLNDEFKGTLIEWQIVLPGKKPAKNPPSFGEDRFRQTSLPFRENGKT